MVEGKSQNPIWMALDPDMELPDNMFWIAILLSPVLAMWSTLGIVWALSAVFFLGFIWGPFMVAGALGGGTVENLLLGFVIFNGVGISGLYITAVLHNSDWIDKVLVVGVCSMLFGLCSFIYFLE